MIKKKRRLVSSLKWAVLAVVLSGWLGEARAVLTSYSPGDLFIGFRRTGEANTLVANIGSASQFLPVSLGGSAAPGSSFQVSFGFIPNTATPVTNLSADLVNVFGASWADNPLDGTGVRWGVVGFTDNAVDNQPTAGLTARSIYLTRARTAPDVPASISAIPSAIGDRSGFSTAFNAFANGIGGGSYINQQSTPNSSVAYIGPVSDVNNWNSRIGANRSFGLGSGRSVEQALSGNFSGPTNSFLDLWLSPNTGSTLVTQNTYLGTFTLNPLGELTFQAVPEPSVWVLTGLGVAALLLLRRGTSSQPSRASATTSLKNSI